MIKPDTTLIGALIAKHSNGSDVTASHSFDITNTLPPNRLLKGPFFLCFGQILPGHWVVHIRYSKTRCGFWRRIDELVDGVSRSLNGRPVWSKEIVDILNWHGLTTDMFTNLAIRLHNQIRKAEESSMASAT